jgi:hypothetical protein
VHWPFEEGSGNTTADVTAQPYDGTLVNTPAWMPGRVGRYALAFNGTTQYVQNTALTWAPNQPISVAFWIYTAGGSPGGAFSIGGVDWPNRVGAHVPWSDNILYWDYGSFRMSVDFSPYLNSWTHVVLVSNGVNFKGIYLYGQRVAVNSTVTAAPTVPLTTLNVGRYVVNQASGYTTGALDDFRLYPTVLSEEEILGLYRATGIR